MFRVLGFRCVYIFGGGGARTHTHSHPPTHTHAFVFFRGLLRRTSRGKIDEETLEGIWLLYDSDKDGFISQQEMRDALSRECRVMNEVIYVM